MHASTSDLLLFTFGLVAMVTIVGALVTIAVASICRAEPTVPVVTLDPDHWLAWLAPGDRLASGETLRPGQAGLRLPGVDITGSVADLADLGEHIGLRWQGPLVAALIASVDREVVLGNGSFARSLGCDTVDALAKVLALAGHYDTAVQVLSLHGEADDEPDYDRHANLRDLGLRDEYNAMQGQVLDYELRDTAAADYLRALVA